MSGAATLRDVGTIRQPGSGKRLGAQLTGIDPPTLRGLWDTAPYLHDGSAAHWPPPFNATAALRSDRRT
jgi:hypothetical protein